METRSITPAMIVFEAHRHLKQHRIVVKFVLELPGYPKRVGAGPIAFVDECDAGDFVAHHLPVDGNGLGLDPADGTQNQYGPVEYPECTFDFNGKVDWPGVSMMLIGCSSQEQRVAADWIVMPRSFSSSMKSIVAPTPSFPLTSWIGVNSPGVKKDTFGKSRFSRINMCADADISQPRDFLCDLVGHMNSPRKDRRPPCSASFRGLSIIYYM